MIIKEANSYHRLPILDGLELLNARNHTINFPYHTHDTFNIALILGHAFNTQLTNKFLQAPTGTLSITNPQEVHATPCDSKSGNSFFTFYVSPDVLKQMNKGKEVFFEDKVIYNAALFQQLYFLSQNFSQPGIAVEQKLQRALAILVKNYATAIEFKYKHKQLFKNFMEEDGLGKFSLEQLSRRFELDRFKFLRLFKQQTGLTPNNYLILKKIEKSKVLLQGDQDLLDIAIEVGFYDAAHLCRHFKRFTGVTPQEYKYA